MMAGPSASNSVGGARLQQPGGRRSTIGADYLNTRQLFSQDESQTQEIDGDEEGVAEERRIQQAFALATEQHKMGRRVTFTDTADEEATKPSDGDEIQHDSEDLDDTDVTPTISQILHNLDQGAAEFAKEVQARPNYVYNLMGKLCSQLRLLQEHHDLLLQSNERNKTMRDRLTAQYLASQERLQAATQRITELSSEEEDTEREARASAQLVKMKQKTQWYADQLKEKEVAVNKLNSEVADLAADNDDLVEESDRLRKELDEHKERRGRSPTRAQSPREPSTSLSPWSKAHNANMGPLTGRSHDVRNARDARHARHTARSESRVATYSEIAQRGLRGVTAATAVSNSSSVHIDPTSKSSIQVDRSIKDPDKFKGDTNTFYPWLSSMTLKLSTATFRTEDDGLRYVQGFLSGTPWALVSPRIPTIGGWGKPCLNPFKDVDTMMKLLAERFGENNTEERAMSAMVSLKQTDKQDFNDFYAKYQEYQAYAPASSDKQEAFRLQGKLNSRFREKLADGMECSSLQDLVNRCTRLQTQWEAMEADKSNGNKRSESKKGARRGRNGKDGDTAGSSSGAGHSLRRINLPDKDIPKEFKDLPPLTNELRASLRETGGCYKCRRKGHQASQRDKCPLGILEDAHDKRTKVNQVQVEDVAEPSGNGMATR